MKAGDMLVWEWQGETLLSVVVTVDEEAGEVELLLPDGTTDIVTLQSLESWGLKEHDGKITPDGRKITPDGRHRREAQKKEDKNEKR